jgi:hypothetical protein
MKTVLLCALMFPMPAAAKDLICIPSKICVASDCSIQVTQAAEILLKHPDSVAPSLVRTGDTIAVTKVMERNGVSVWESELSVSEHEVLQIYLVQNKMNFLYLIDGNEGQYKASGQCEVR